MAMKPQRVKRPTGARPAKAQKRERGRKHDAKRRREQEYRAWYKLPVWQAIRDDQLAMQPLCERHLKRGQVVAATTVHHVEPHKGVWEKFISGPFESTCKTCHDSECQREERLGYSPVVGEDGFRLEGR